MCTQALAQVIPRLPHLEKFYCHCDTEEVSLVALSESLVLKDIRFPRLAAATFPTLKPGSFPAIEIFRIADKSPLVVGLVSSITSSYVRQINASFTDAYLNMHTLASLIGTLWPRSLTLITLQWCLDSGAYTLPTECFEPLYSCRQLEEFVVGGDLVCEFNNQTIGAIGGAWSKLQVLQIRSEPRMPPRVTLFALHRLSQACPDLKCLVAPADASGITRQLPCNNGPNPCIPTHLSSLGFIYPTCGHAEYVADFINHAFPALKTLTARPWEGSSADDTSTVADEWVDVVRILKASRPHVRFDTRRNRGGGFLWS
jgi:hypothetical protein